MTRNSRPRRVKTSSLAGLLLAGVLPAIYVRSQLEEVPLDRLIANAGDRVEAAPADVFALHTLARIHAMAYAWKLGGGDPVEASPRDDGLLVPSFGYEPPWVPWTRPRQHATRQPSNGGTTGTEATAREHLETAIALYRRALDAEPDNPIVRLGLAWTLLERGDRSEARDLLRAVVEAAAPRELERGGHLGPLLAVEAIDYLVPLLDSAEDGAAEHRAEIERLGALRAKLEALPQAITPIAVALRAGKAPAELFDATRPVRFDLDGSGRQQAWPWIAEGVAWLVWDRDGDGGVRSGLQMFGSRSFGLFFDDGYQALELLDDDRDGVLRGAELSGLALWRDADRDGVSGPGEVETAAEAGIVAIGCRATARRDGMLGAPASIELESGGRLDSWDLVLEAVKEKSLRSGSGSRPGAGRTTSPE